MPFFCFRTLNIAICIVFTDIVMVMQVQLTTYLSHISPNYYYRIKHVEFDVFRNANKFCFLAMLLQPR
jgi:hypothetical protein